MRTLSEIKPGQTIGRYEFLVPIAEGGMASVWAARLKGTRGFQKTLAVKTMRASLSGREQFEEMFLDEARIASRIKHPNVVEIFDLGEENEVLYIVMEWVDGEPLSTIFRSALKKGAMPLPIALRIVSDALAGLHAAHELKDDDDKLVSLVHRDVSPQNILVSYDGAIKLVDFGVAKAEGRESENTMAGTVKGKAPYMAPEQALGRPIDRRTDIFAMGIVLYQLTTGKHPFRAESDIMTLHQIVEKQCMPPSQVVPGFPRMLEQVILKSLDKDAKKRFQSAAEFEAALDRVLPPTAPRVRTSDVARFVRETVGERGDKRREAIRAAVRLADERLQNEIDAAKLAQRPVNEIGSGSRASIPAFPGRLGSSPAIPTASAPPHTPGPLPALRLPSLDSVPPQLTTTGHSNVVVDSRPLPNITPPPANVVMVEEEAPDNRVVIYALTALAAVAVAVIVFTAASRGRHGNAAAGQPMGTSPSATAEASTPVPPAATSVAAPPTATAATAPAKSVQGLDLSSLPPEVLPWPAGHRPGGIDKVRDDVPEPPKTATPEPPKTAAPPTHTAKPNVPPVTDPGFD